MLIALCAAACGSGEATDGLTIDDTASDASLPTATAPGDPTAQLECEQLGYPCSLAQVPVEVLRRSNDLGATAHQRLDDGSTMAEVADWLSGLGDVVEVEADESAVRYRVEGGRGFWVLGDGLTDARSAPSSVGPAVPAITPLPRTITPSHIVGPGDDIKSALVLSPVLYQFANTDDGPVIADLLNGSADYAGNVTFKGNDTVSSTEVTLDDFETWTDFDVVHVSTHGKRICAQEPCRGMIVAGPLDAVLPPGPGEQIDKIAGLDLLDRPGVGISISRSGNGYVILTADFFRATYQGGLNDTFVFFNACQTLGGGQTDLAEAISGMTSAFMGWSDVVNGRHSLDTAVALYTDMVDNGVTVDDAFDALDGDLIVGDAYQDYGPPVLNLRDRNDGDHLRIREVVELLQPGTSDPVELADVPVEGTIGDGEPDAVPYRVRVEGHDELQAAAAVLHVAVDGVEAEPRSVDEGSSDGEGAWIVDGSVELGADVAEERDASMRAWVELPDGGESFDEETVSLTGEPLMGTRWELVATHTSTFINLPSTPQTETATLELVFEPGQDQDEPKPRYVLEGGTVDVDFDHTYGDCVYTADPFSFDVAPEDFYGVQFDTTAGTVQYTGYVITQSPSFVRVDDCGDGPTPRDHRITTAWLDLRDQWKPITDATTVMGVQEVQDGCCYVRRSEYTLRRVD